MARLVIVSNRVPLPKSRTVQAGGLAVVLKEALGPNTTWFGWSGVTAEETSKAPETTEIRGVRYATINLSEDDYRQFYLGFANGTLWPLFHSRPGIMTFEREELEGYIAVNRSYAAALSKILRPDHQIWVHDYHLIPLGAELRSLGVKNPIGFFLHVPFVPASIFGLLPCATRLLEELMAYDLIGVQTESHLRDLKNAMTEILGAKIGSDGSIEANGLRSQAFANPAGIDSNSFRKIAEESVEGPEAKRLTDSLVGRSLIIGVDRLDYSKGLPNRFEGYGRFLRGHPEYRLKVSYLQVAALSRTEVPMYRTLRRELDRLAGDINGRYAEFDWVPLRYMTRAIARETLAGFFRLARVGLITPLRDGMNLVAKEYVAAQSQQDPGVLILSRFAGAADTMPEAIIVNPYDADEIAGAIAQALSMPLAERIERHSALLSEVQRTSARSFCLNFLGEFAKVKEASASKNAQSLVTASE